MRTFHHKKNPDFCPIVNVDSIWTLVSEATLKTKRTDKKVPVIDVTKRGFHKVLGKGKLIRKPVIVKARFFSATAERKIKAAGGVCVLTA
jgi:large subunit ribosomal protein L27Ae